MQPQDTPIPPSLNLKVDTPHLCELRIGQIRVEGRHRANLGDIKSLADSIAALGLIHPIVITPDHRLVAGERRLAAVESLGWDVTPVTVIHTLADATDLLLAERDENSCRKDFTASEMVALGRQLEELERPKQDEARLAGNRRGAEITNFGQSPVELRPAASTDKIVGKALGVSGSTYKRAKLVDKATNDSDPAVAEVAREQMSKLDARETSFHAAEDAVKNARAGRPSQPVNKPKPLAPDEPKPNPAAPGDTVTDEQPMSPPQRRMRRKSATAVVQNFKANIVGMANAIDDYGLENLREIDMGYEEAQLAIKEIGKALNQFAKIQTILKGIKQK